MLHRDNLSRCRGFFLAWKGGDTQIVKTLIVGNGFDLAHGLPTKYTDFLSRSIKFLDYANGGALEGNDLWQVLNSNNVSNEFHELVNENVWLDYFIQKYQTNSLRGEKWIDCEREIKEVISNYEMDYISNSGYLMINFEQTDLLCFIKGFDDFRGKDVFFEDIKGIIGKPMMEPLLSEFIEFLFQQLRLFTRAFEIYCLYFVNKTSENFAEKYNTRRIAEQIHKLQVKQNRLQNPYSEDIDNKDTLIKDTGNELKEIQVKYGSLVPLQIWDFDYVLSFNYTNTFEMLYGNTKTQFCYIHGKAQSNPSETNFILGIDDSLSEEYENNLFAFAKFKKYFQRIFYKTGSEYKNWINELHASDSCDTHEIYIVGHSLGLTDHEALKEFFNIDDKRSDGFSKVRITIFYFDEISKINSIERVVEMIHKETLIERVHGERWSVRFVNQYDENEGIMKRWDKTEFKTAIEFKL